MYRLWILLNGISLHKWNNKLRNEQRLILNVLAIYLGLWIDVAGLILACLWLSSFLVYRTIGTALLPPTPIKEGKLVPRHLGLVGAAGRLGGALIIPPPPLLKITQIVLVPSWWWLKVLCQNKDTSVYNIISKPVHWGYGSTLWCSCTYCMLRKIPHTYLFFTLIFECDA